MGGVLFSVGASVERERKREVKTTMTTMTTTTTI